MNVDIWTDNQFTSPGFSEAGSAVIASSAEQELPAADQDHNSIEVVIQYKDLTPDDNEEFANYKVAAVVESRESQGSPWKTIGVQRQGKSSIADGDTMQIVVQPQMLVLDDEENVQVANKQVGRISRHQGYLRKYFRICLIVSQNDGDSQPGKFVDVTVSANANTYKS